MNHPAKYSWNRERLTLRFIATAAKQKTKSKPTSQENNKIDYNLIKRGRPFCPKLSQLHCWLQAGFVMPISMGFVPTCQITGDTASSTFTPRSSCWCQAKERYVLNLAVLVLECLAASRQLQHIATCSMTAAIAAQTAEKRITI